MPDLSGLPALDVLLGIAFLYFVLSIVTSTINEVIAARLKLRARDLETGLRQLLGDEETFKRFISSPRIRALHDPKGRLPSYIPPRAFSLALLDTLAPPTAGTSHDVIAHAKDAVEKIQNPAVQTLLNDALKEARGDADHFRLSMERSFDDVMNRVSGWYKRRVQKILFVIGLLLTLAVNADSFAVGERLWKDDAVRAAVVETAGNQQADTTCPDVEADPSAPIDYTAECVDEVEELGIPLGWTDDTTPDEFGREWLGKLAGLLLTAIALSFGAPFWFDVLSRLARLRGSGGREPPATMDDRPPSERPPASQPVAAPGRRAL